ncbi:TetR/AcrR family transcriptional regulator [Bradyrhizobium cenepequi]|uniref:TetR/AcrR family transcriptional regulator n=1 Tax=Bradyrhizobium cenepequi TaxID=2821403 RepID=UPI001CE2B08D|nr:TetR family transcriptional regulator [Bradyrhizobium cenepequi]MCA6113128.1 TetR family transcriptional regulator [Bradyrhizobium cenepequi]
MSETGQPAPSEAFDRDQQRRRKRLAVLKTAASAFNRRGFANTSMDDVASALGISKPALYQYFKSKQDILYECHLLAVQHGEAGVEEGQRTRGSGLDKLLAYVGRYMHGFFSDLGSCAVLLDVYSLADKHRAEIQKRRDGVTDAVEGFIARGIKDGSIVERDAKLTALFIFGVLNWMLVWYRPSGPATPAQIIETFVSLLERGLAARASVLIESEPKL